jgi:hypothetical protein
MSFAKNFTSIIPCNVNGDESNRIKSKISFKYSNKDLKIIITIINRFKNKYKINLLYYIKSITKVGFALDEGFYFTTSSTWEIRNALMNTKNFVYDSDSIIGCIASSQTNGDSYRELGKKQIDKSLHLALSPGVCSVHLDETLFTFKDYDGKPYYSLLNIPQHFVYDLCFRDFIVKNVRDVPYLGWTLDKVRLNTPGPTNGFNASAMFRLGSNIFSGEAGIGFKVNFRHKSNNDFILNPGNYLKASDPNLFIGVSVNMIPILNYLIYNK